METHAQMETTRPRRDAILSTRCRCGQRLHWTQADLEIHLRMLDAGEHAAPACDDDCAVETAPWSRTRLIRAIRRAESEVGNG